MAYATVPPAPSPLCTALTCQASHSISSKDSSDLMARVYHTDAQLLTGHQQWGNVPTNQCENEPYTMGPQHSCHILPSMPDTRLVHLSHKSKTVKD